VLYKNDILKATDNEKNQGFGRIRILKGKF